MNGYDFLLQGNPPKTMQSVVCPPHLRCTWGTMTTLWCITWCFVLRLWACVLDWLGRYNWASSLYSPAHFMCQPFNVKDYWCYLKRAWGGVLPSESVCPALHKQDTSHKHVERTEETVSCLICLYPTLHERASIRISRRDGLKHRLLDPPHKALDSVGLG